MKKIVSILVLLVALFTMASAESGAIDLSGMTPEELLALNQQTAELLTEAVLAKTRSDLLAHTTDSGLVMADNGQEVMVRGYRGTATEVVIPAEYNGLPVTRIGEKAFENNDQIVSVVLPDTVTMIGNNAFYSCDHLRSINLENVSSIGEKAFYYAGLTGTLVLRAESVVIDGQAFRDTKLTGVKVYSKSIKMVGLYPFVNMDELQYMFFSRDTIISSTTSYETISYNPKLETVVLPQSVSFRSDGEFGGCPLLSIYAPAGSSAEAFAKEHFLVCNTGEYDAMYSLFEGTP